MRSSLPKVLHPVCGRPMVAWPVIAARDAGAERVAVIVSADRDLGPALPEGVETVVQPEVNGTGGAVRAAIETIRAADAVVVLSGDHPLISAEIISELLDTHRARDAAATVMTVELDDPGAYGRVVRDADGHVAEIVETKDPDQVAPEVLAIREINTGTYAFAAAPLAECLVRDLERQLGRRVLPRRRAAAAARARPARRRPQGERSARQPRRQQPRRPGSGRGRGAAPDLRAPHAGRGHDRRSRLGLDRRRGPDRRRRDDRARDGAARHDRRRCRRRGRPALDRDRLPDRRRGPHRPLSPGRGRGRRRDERRPVRLPASRRRARHRRQGGELRRDQELPARRAGEGARTSPTSAMPRSAPAPTSAPGRSPPTTTGATRTGRRSGKLRGSRSTHRWSLRSRSATAHTLAPAR